MPIQNSCAVIDENALQTPYYLIDENALYRNLEIVATVRRLSGAKVLLALKSFSSWVMFEVMRDYMNGTTSSSLYEVRLGREKFGGETHAYSVAFADHEIDTVLANASMITFNSISQLTRFGHRAKAIKLTRGLRLNPGFGFSNFLLANPTRPFSRLGESNLEHIEAVLDQLEGVMIHNHCDNEDFAQFDTILTQLEDKFCSVFEHPRIKWVNLGGGVAFTKDGYPVAAFCARLKAFAERFNVQVYLEPGAAVVAGTATLEVTVLDTLFNDKHLAIVDSSVEAHMLDALTYYPQGAKITVPAGEEGSYRTMICGKSCLAGDIFGEVAFQKKLQPGDRISIQDAAEYNMVQKNWFNGLQMPAIVVRGRGGDLRSVREFSFEDYVASLS